MLPRSIILLKWYLYVKLPGILYRKELVFFFPVKRVITCFGDLSSLIPELLLIILVICNSNSCINFEVIDNSILFFILFISFARF